MQDSYSAVFNTPIGKIGIKTEFEKLISVNYLPETVKNFKEKEYFVKEVITQLQAYFSQPQFHFTLPINPEGTLLQKEIWHALRNIPKGTTTTYGSLAESLTTNPRVVGNACRKNPIPIIIPCHRVVAANNLGGYSGQTQGDLIKIKKWLLHHEGLNCD